MNKELKEVLESIKIPFEMIQALQSVLDSLDENKFKYKGIKEEEDIILSFKRGKDETLTLAIQKEHLYVRQFGMEDGKRKLRIVYVVKPSERKFELINR